MGSARKDFNKFKYILGNHKELSCERDRYGLDGITCYVVNRDLGLTDSLRRRANARKRQLSGLFTVANSNYQPVKLFTFYFTLLPS